VLLVSRSQHLTCATLAAQVTSRPSRRWKSTSESSRWPSGLSSLVCWSVLCLLTLLLATSPTKSTASRWRLSANLCGPTKCRCNACRRTQCSASSAHILTGAAFDHASTVDYSPPARDCVPGQFLSQQDCVQGGGYSWNKGLQGAARCYGSRTQDCDVTPLATAAADASAMPTAVATHPNVWHVPCWIVPYGWMVVGEV
jgi:hypothetical protein